MMEQIRLDPATPLEEQVYRHLKLAFLGGTLVVGEPLPSARVWAGQLGVHWNTVARAYRRLANEGILHVRPGRRTVVGKALRPAAPTERSREAVRRKLREAAVEAQLSGLSQTAVRTMFIEELRSLRTPRRR